MEEKILHNAGSFAVFNIALERNGQKWKKKLLQHGVFVHVHLRFLIWPISMY